jgi:hypothetical protein
LALLSRNREKSSFDKLRMISRYAQLSNLQLVAPSGQSCCSCPPSGSG